jgi:hypothetical protein
VMYIMYHLCLSDHYSRYYCLLYEYLYTKGESGIKVIKFRKSNHHPYLLLSKVYSLLYTIQQCP